MSTGAPTQDRIDALLRRAGYTDAGLDAAHQVMSVLPFKVSTHIVDRLVDWSAAPDDPIFRLYFPHPDMLAAVPAATAPDDTGADDSAGRGVAVQLNPHPGGQLEHNVPRIDGAPVHGLQHKYADTVLVFPGRGQTCHAYCAYCFRWAQFVGAPDLQMRMDDPATLGAYLDGHPEVSNVVLTGGDPFVMGAHVLGRWLDEASAPHREHIDVVRIGTKAPLSNPERFTRSNDADDLLAALERVVRSGRQCAVMLHVSHARELAEPLTQQALARLRSTGATLYSQAPLIRHVNDDAQVWQDKWTLESRLGIVPYYMFVERDTGPWRYFAVPLADAVTAFTTAYGRVGGLARTVRGPVMSTTLGKLQVSRRPDDGGDDGGPFALTFLRARVPAHQGATLLARPSRTATWVSELDGCTPADDRLLRLAAAG
jgi:L-lysine 2,3-aminomutase